MRSQSLLSDYIFSAGTGSQIDISGGTVGMGTNQDDSWSGVFNIGFNFVFCGSTYSQFGVCSNGYITLGTSSSVQLTTNLATTNWGVPVICGVSRDLHTGSDGYIKYQTVGTAPNRICVVEFRVRDFPGAGTPTNTTFQIRLYETTNKFEIWYGPVGTSSGSVGAKNNSNSNFASINAGPPATVSYVTGYSTIPPSNQNVLYSFSLCSITPVGNLAQGGTALMVDQDSLMKTITVQRGNSGTFQPFTINGPGCAPQTMNFTITGANAADYSISPTSSSISAATPITPTITFNPQGPGKRVATLTASAPGYTRTYYLAATTAPRITYTTNIPQGGTPALANGDTLLQNVSIPRHQTINVTPFTLTNINTNGAAPGAVVTYTIKGSSGGQFTINPVSTTIGATQTNTPVITFNAQGIGWIQDTLTVVADGEVRVFGLRAFSQAPGIVMRYNNVVLDTNSALFRNEYGCIGEGAVTYRVDVTNIGNLPLYINSVDFFKTDTAYRQGIPRYPLLRNTNGSLIPSSDYIVTDAPPVVPISANHSNFPILITGSQTRTIFVTFIAQDRDKRFVRAFFHTNGENVVNNDVNGVPTIGLIWIDMFARGIGSKLTNDAASTSMKPVTFPPTRVGETSDIKVPVYNPGECQLRISLKSASPVSGDVDEFSVVSMPSANVDPTTNDVLLAPGASDTMVLRFHPIQSGSRRASLRLLTNDSTRVVPGITEKGVYYLDLYGFGRTGLYGKDIDFGTVLIGGGATEQHTGTVHLDNTTAEPMTITSITLTGTDSADFQKVNWPSGTYHLEPGAGLDLDVTFAPTALPTGSRTTTIIAVSSNGDTITAHLTGTAGTRMLTANPTALDFKVANGRFFRRTLTLTNSGTMPLTIKDMSVAPVGNDYTMSPLVRKVLEPGQSEFVEITYAPVAGSGGTSQLTINSNGTNSPTAVALNAVTYKARSTDNDPSQTVLGGHNGDAGTVGNAGDNLDLSGVAGEDVVNGMRLWQSVPNPARDQVEIRYSLAKGADVSLELYDASGRLVKVLDGGMRGVGEQRVVVDVRDLASGVYHYRLTANGTSISKAMTVAR